MNVFPLVPFLVLFVASFFRANMQNGSVSSIREYFIFIFATAIGLFCDGAWKKQFFHGAVVHQFEFSHQF